MKKIICILTLFTTYIFSNINVVVSILPEKSFVKAIGGEKVTIMPMVLPGNSPHTYEPKPSQMKKIAQANLYFAIGVEFERAWLPRFHSLNPHMQVIDVTQGIQKEPMSGHSEHTHSPGDKEVHLDPHVWTSPANVRIIAKNICDALIRTDSGNRHYYEKNLQKFTTEIGQTEVEISTILREVPKGTKFMVFHPSWGYFAHAFGLIQLPVEIEGKNPKPRELIRLVKEAKKEKIKALFTQPEFSDAMAKTIAQELHIPVVKVSPMSEDWAKSLRDIAHAVADGR